MKLITPEARTQIRLENALTSAKKVIYMCPMATSAAVIAAARISRSRMLPMVFSMRGYAGSEENAVHV